MTATTLIRHVTAPATDWRYDAACIQVDPEAMHPADGDHAEVHAAKVVCAPCPVRDRCLRQAVDMEEPWGIWGGFTPAERKRLANGRKPQRCSGCQLLFVGRLATQRRCSRCAVVADRWRHRPTGRGRRIEDVRELIESYVAQGWYDTEIGRSLGISRDGVRAARRRWGLANGAGTRVAKPGDDVVHESAVRQVIGGVADFATLNTASRVEVYRHHAAAGGTSSGFVRRYRVSGSTASRLRCLAEQGAEASTR
jgi:WhiB family redox-sensing transcriptional regulator